MDRPDRDPVPRASGSPLTGRLRHTTLAWGSVPGRDLVPVLVITAAAAVPRLWRIDAVGFRGDEAVYAGQAALLAGVHDMGHWFVLASRGSSNFLVFQGILSLVYRAFGVSDLAARLVSAGFSILTVPVVYAIGRIVYGSYGRRAAFFAGLAIATSGYAVGLGRLALLDSTQTFFVALAVLCLAAWHRTDRPGWLYGFAGAAAVATQVKVTSVLVVPLAVLFVAASRPRPHLTIRRLAAAAAVATVCLTPVLLQVATRAGSVADFLSTSVRRSSGVPWYYYLETFWNHEGTAMTAVVGVSLLLAIMRRSRSDLLPALWLGVYALFLQAYPLKGFNYLLPAAPPLALFTGRAAAELWEWLARGLPHALRRWRPLRWAAGGRPAAGLATGLLVVPLVAAVAPSVHAAVQDDTSAGLREAAQWLEQHGAAHAGVMMTSHGSAQYVLSFYGGIDAYPFGRFRLDTIVPGGRVVKARPRPDGRVPLDWVTYWPTRLIRQGVVSYLVYYTKPLDDPPEQSQIVGTLTQEQFRALIETHGGKLVHRIYWRNEARVYIYEITKSWQHPAVGVSYGRGVITIAGHGFVVDSPVTVTYHGKVMARARTDRTGAVSVTAPVPRFTQLPYHLVVTDAAGYYASTFGLPSTELVYAVTSGRVVVQGSGYTPGASVTVSYFRRPLERAKVQRNGQFTASFPLPAPTQPRYRIRATDTYGRSAWAVGLGATSIEYTVTGRTVNVRGIYFFPHSVVTLRYQGAVVGHERTDGRGRFTSAFPLPHSARPRYQLVATDETGRRASATGLGRGG